MGNISKADFNNPGNRGSKADCGGEIEQGNRSSALHQRPHSRESPCEYHEQTEPEEHRRPHKICHGERLPLSLSVSLHPFPPSSPMSSLAGLLEFSWLAALS